MNLTQIESTGAAKGSFRTYSSGFVLSVILTGIAFALVISNRFSRPVVVIGIFALAVAQMLVHLHFFLHLDRSSASRWNILALILTVLIMGLFVVGTFWIMHNLNYRMM